MNLTYHTLIPPPLPHESRYIPSLTLLGHAEQSLHSACMTPCDISVTDEVS
jgi:hypothetical protein